MKSRSPALPALLLAAAWATACSGQIAPKAEGSSGSGAPGAGSGNDPGDIFGGSTGTGSSTGNGGSPSAMGPSAVANAPGPAPLRRLSIREYNNTVRDLLGVGSAPADSFATDQDNGGYSFGGPISTSVDAERLLDAAEQVATAASAKIAALIPCPNVAADPTAQSDCAHQFIQQFGKRAFRRPLSPDEVTDLMAVYTAHRDPAIGYAFPDSIRALVTAMLMSPAFLYRAELGASQPIKDGPFVRFNSYEMASRLSYSLWGSMPDDQLFTAADNNGLATPDDLEKQARRMLQDPRARDTIADFNLQWLEVAGLPNEAPKDAKFTAYTPALVAAMMAETSTFAADTILGSKTSGSLQTLLTSPVTNVDPALAKLYGATATGTGPVTLDPSQRAGVFTQASFLAMHATATDSHPVKRGAAVIRRLMCADIQPPANMDVGQAAAPAPGLTTRQRFAMHAEQACATCHRLTDPIGFAFETYDAIGAYRTTEQGVPVDASGTVVMASGNVTFKDAVGLMKGLAEKPEVRDCMATQWMRYFLRRLEVPGDAASIASAADTLGKSGYDIREMLVALTRTPSFTHRSPSAGELLP